VLLRPSPKPLTDLPFIPGTSSRTCKRMRVPTRCAEVSIQPLSSHCAMPCRIAFSTMGCNRKQGTRPSKVVATEDPDELKLILPELKSAIHQMMQLQFSVPVVTSQMKGAKSLESSEPSSMMT
jgi:hypothetical protein